MKYIITITILTTIALCINVKISNDIKWQKKAEQKYHKDLSEIKFVYWGSYKGDKSKPMYIGYLDEGYYYPKELPECSKWVYYVLAQDKYYSKKKQ